MRLMAKVNDLTFEQPKRLLYCDVHSNHSSNPLLVIKGPTGLNIAILFVTVRALFRKGIGEIVLSHVCPEQVAARVP